VMARLVQVFRIYNIILYFNLQFDDCLRKNTTNSYSVALYCVTLL